MVAQRLTLEGLQDLEKNPHADLTDPVRIFDC